MRGFVAFDLDGVLYSSEPFLGEAYREAIANVNQQRPGSFPRVPTTREILDHVGWPLALILERLFPHVDAAARDLLSTETLRVICAHVERREGMVFTDVAATLAGLQARGLRLAVASNGRASYLESVLRAHALGAYFVDVISIDRQSYREKADLLRAYGQREGIACAQMIMIGDRASDVEAARAVGCRFIGCDYGHGYRHELEGAGPIVAAFAELPAIIEDLLAGRGA